MLLVDQGRKVGSFPDLAFCRFRPQAKTNIASRFTTTATVENVTIASIDHHVEAEVRLSSDPRAEGLLVDGAGENVATWVETR